jgi:hypothetical protein
VDCWIGNDLIAKHRGYGTCDSHLIGNTSHSSTDKNQDASHSEMREAKMEATINTDHGRLRSTMKVGQEEMKTMINSIQFKYI